MITNINELWNEKIGELSTRIRQIARGDDDLYQEGLLGLRDALLKDANVGNGYLIGTAKRRMRAYRNKGVSIDNGDKRYRKNVVPIYIDNGISNFELAFPDSSYPPDILALDRICAKKFYNLLNQSEAELVNARIQSYRESEARERLGIGRDKYRRIKREAHIKFIRAFGSDEDVQTLDQQLVQSEMHE